METSPIARKQSSAFTSPARRGHSDEDLAVAIARALDGANCENIVVLDVRGASQVTNFTVIASGTSNRQIHTAITKAAEEAAQLGASVFGSSEDANVTWALLDLIDVVVHVFEPMARAHYALEILWGDTPRVDWRPAATRSDTAPPPAADSDAD